MHHLFGRHGQTLNEGRSLAEIAIGTQGPKVLVVRRTVQGYRHAMVDMKRYCVGGAAA